MFQATEIMEGRQRPAIMHAYGGAKAGMERSLASIAAASVGLRPVAGTTIDFKVLPPSLSEREKLLMLSCWQLGSRALPCPNGLLELMLTLDRMGVTPLPT